MCRMDIFVIVASAMTNERLFLASLSVSPECFLLCTFFIANNTTNEEGMVSHRREKE